MKFIAAASLVSLAYAAPALVPRQFGQSMNEFTGAKGACKSATMVYTRGTAEPGNVGVIIGPPLFTQIKKLYPDIAIQGVEYGAGLFGNFATGGADAGGVTNATNMFTQVATQCPKTIIIGGGYSQGAAVMHRTVEKIDPAVRNRIEGVILYGDTQNRKDAGQIKDYPKDKVKIFCNDNDGVCGDRLNVNAGHFSYGSSMEPGAKWVVDKIKAAGGSPGAAAAPAAGSSAKTSSARTSSPKTSSPKTSSARTSSPKAAAPATSTSTSSSSTAAKASPSSSSAPAAAPAMASSASAQSASPPAMPTGHSHAA